MKKQIVCLLVLALALCCLFASCQSTPAEKKKEPYVLRIGTTVLAVDAEAAPVLAALGAAKETIVKPSCAFAEGNDVCYVYDGFRIDTYVKGGTEYLYNIEIVDDSVGTATPEGITTASTREEILAAYGKADEEIGGNLSYSADGMKLLFIFQDSGSVSIQYRKDGIG